MKRQLKVQLQERLDQYIAKVNDDKEAPTLRKLELLERREVELIRVQGTGKVLTSSMEAEDTVLVYEVHLQYLLKQRDSFFIEEEIEEREARFCKGILIKDRKLDRVFNEETPGDINVYPERLVYQYDRLKAVKYAERWWNEFNPAYPKFQDDCSSYISQCLHAGGIPMWGSPNRSRGWWMHGKNWSYSWTVANALRKLLANGTGIRTKEVRSAEDLNIGDIICVDFQGDGRFDHSLMVTAKDENGMPLVNAHTTNSRHRYWTYEDSSAYTPNIAYEFYSILDGG